jgi:hypothetical protein
MTAAARWLLVVDPGQLDLYQHLAARFDGIDFLEVIVDRRKGERREVHRDWDARVAADRRRADRRRPPTPKEREQWALFGYRLIRRGAPPP